MTITYFLGNGFDLALGLKTRYKDFLKYYRESNASDSQLVALLKKQIDENSETWADAEEAFGQLDFSSFAETLHMPLLDTIVGMDEDFQRSLRDYLIRQEESFRRAISQKKGIGTKLLSNAASSIREVIASNRFFDSIRKMRKDEMLVVNFITLNYTETIDTLLEVDEGVRGSIALNNDFWESRGFGYLRLGAVVHAHGRLSDRFRLFGVDNEGQIVDRETSELCKETGLLIKTKEDMFAPVGDRAGADEIIRESDFIVIFGTSYGATDTYWWNSIARAALDESKLSKILLCPYTKNPFVCSSPGAVILRAAKEIERFYSKVDHDMFFNRFRKDMCAMLSEGPYITSEGNESFCDPLGLSEIRSMVSGS